MERFNLKKLNEEEGKEQFCVAIWTQREINSAEA
jgi:hypothetical protein